MVLTKKVKVFPRPKREVCGILPNNERISVPSELTLNVNEIRKCLNVADVYEVVDGVGDVLLDAQNYEEDNSKATPATDVPNVELDHPQDNTDGPTGSGDQMGEEEGSFDESGSEMGVDNAKVEDDPTAATGDEVGNDEETVG